MTSDATAQAVGPVLGRRAGVDGEPLARLGSSNAQTFATTVTTIGSTKEAGGPRCKARRGSPGRMIRTPSLEGLAAG